MKKFIKYLFFSILIITVSSCATVKEYQKINLNDPDMKLSNSSVDRFENTFQSYRESSAGANGGKTGGGCGCN